MQRGQGYWIARVSLVSECRRPWLTSKDTVVSLLAALLAHQAPANDPAIRGHTAHLQLQHLAVFQCQFEDLAVLRNWW